jgi:hypothetical protein
MQETVKYREESILKEMANTFVKPQKSSKSYLSLFLSLTLFVSFAGSLLFLLLNYDSLINSEPVAFLLYNSLVIANIFFVARTISVPILALIEMDFSEAVEKGTLDYLKEKGAE